MKRRVYIANGPARAYEAMYLKEGWDITTELDDADLVQFLGGADVSPLLYGRKAHPKTQFNERTDELDIEVYEAAQERGIPCVGICRGGQFLNVMSGGKMFQHIEGHCGEHITNLHGVRDHLLVSSTHHQMMQPSKDGFVLMSNKPLGDRYEEIGVGGQTIRYHSIKEDVEAVYYEDTNCLCFQPHPEFDGYEECRKAFFFLVNNYLFDSRKPNEEDYIPF